MFGTILRRRHVYYTPLSFDTPMVEFKKIISHHFDHLPTMRVVIVCPMALAPTARSLRGNGVHQRTLNRYGPWSIPHNAVKPCLEE